MEEGHLKGGGEPGLASQGGNKDKTAEQGDAGPHKLKPAQAARLEEGEEEELEEGEDAELEEANVDLVDDDALVAEVARRVAARLVKEARKKNR